MERDGQKGVLNRHCCYSILANVIYDFGGCRKRIWRTVGLVFELGFYKLRKHTFQIYIYIYKGDRGSTVAKVLCHKSEGRWFDTSWCQWILH